MATPAGALAHSRESSKSPPSNESLQAIIAQALEAVRKSYSGGVGTHFSSSVISIEVDVHSQFMVVGFDPRRWFTKFIRFDVRYSENSTPERVRDIGYLAEVTLGDFFRGYDLPGIDIHVSVRKFKNREEKKNDC